MLGVLAQNDYYSSQAWLDAKAANDALQAAYQEAGDAEASGDPARIAVANQAVTEALHTYETVTSRGYIATTTGPITTTASPTGGTMMATVYRLALRLPDGTWGTGATYPGCSSAHGSEVYQPGSACDPQPFKTLDQVTAYANSRGETVRIVSSEAEAWSIADAEERKRGVAVPVTPTGLPQGGGGSNISLGTVAILAVAAYFLLKKA